MSTSPAIEIEVGGHAVRLSNPDKVLWPATGTTKHDLVRYLLAVAPVLLPHLAGRMLTMKRYPDGVDGDFFYEKQAPSHRPDWVRTVPVELDRRTIDFIIAESAETLVWLANLADIELHTSLAPGDAQQTPSMMVFDLDPGAPATIVECCEIAGWLRDMFAGQGVKALAKTSGSKGMQVYVPLNDDAIAYADTKAFSRAVAELLAKEAPDRVVFKQTRTIRAGRVLVDWSQNDEHKTTINAYSPRARERPTVSTPITWDEVTACVRSRDPEDLAFTMDDVLARVETHGDLFAPALTVRQRLPGL